MDRVKGKVAIVTGAGRIGNIGLAICEAFLREGAEGVVGQGEVAPFHELTPAVERG